MTLKTFLAKCGLRKRETSSRVAHVDDSHNSAPRVKDRPPGHAGYDLTCEHLVGLVLYAESRGSERLVHQTGPAKSVSDGQIFSIAAKALARVRSDADRFKPWSLKDREVFRVKLENGNGSPLNLAAFRLNNVGDRYIGCVADLDRGTFAILTDDLYDWARVYRDLGFRWAREPQTNGYGGKGILGP